MSVPNQIPYIVYNANGMTTVFPFEFYIIAAGDIQVSINGTTVTSGFSVSGTGNVSGGDVVFMTPPAATSVVMLERVVPTYRLTDYQDNGDLLADTINKDFDRLWMAIQHSSIYLGLALRRPLLGGPFDAEGYRIANGLDPLDKQDFATKNYVDNSNATNLSHVIRTPEVIPELPVASERSNKLLAFNAAGNPITVLPQSGSASDVLIELANQGDKKIGSTYGGTVYSDYKKNVYKKHGSFSVGGVVNSREEAMSHSDGYWYVNVGGTLPILVNTGSSPNADWVCVGLLNGYSLSDPLGWGVEYGTTTEQKERFQLQMDSLSKMGGGTIWVDGWIYLKDTVNITVPDPIYVTNQSNHFFAVPDNITIKSNRGYNAGFRVAGGVVAANQGIQYSKGFQVFADAGRPVKNFRAEGFAIDYNGKNNLLPPLSVSDPQALCPGFWFLQGSDIHIHDILHIECPGQQCVVLDYLVNRCSITKNTFFHCGGTLAGNDNINDHSSIFCLASNYKVCENIGIGYSDGSGARFSYESTFIECHGQHGIVSNNKCYGYNCGAIFGAVRNDLFDVVHQNNTYSDVGYGINYDGANNRNFNLLSKNNLITLRPNKPRSNKPSTCHGSSPYEFSSYKYPITAELKLVSVGNTFIQSSPNSDWDENSIGDNMIFEGGKFTYTYLDDDVYGVKSGYRLDYPSGVKFICKDRLHGCGYSNNSTDIAFKTSVFQLQNVDPSFNVSNLQYMDINLTFDKDCKYTTLFNFDTARVPKYINSTVTSINWIGLYGGNDPTQSDYFTVSHHHKNIIEGLGLPYGAKNILGRITVNESTYFDKSNTSASPWLYRGVQDSSSAPVSPRPFGDRRGDIITPRGLNPGGPSLIVCVSDGATPSTLGTWKAAGIISA